MITDAAINIAPTLEEKADIIRNAIDLAHIIGIPEPKVAILSAVETVNPKIQSTLDAAALCKMADRGQIKGGILDGPLAFDNAVSIIAAKTKGIKSAVAGHAEISDCSRSGIRQHGCQTTRIPGQRTDCRHRARDQGSHRTDQSRRHRRNPHRLLRDRRAGRSRQPQEWNYLTMKQGILTINAGSSSIKFALFPLHPPDFSGYAEVSGQIDGIGTNATKLVAKDRGRRAHRRPT
jgi:hypothetical protein